MPFLNCSRYSLCPISRSNGSIPICALSFQSMYTIHVHRIQEANFQPFIHVWSDFCVIKTVLIPTYMYRRAICYPVFELKKSTLFMSKNRNSLLKKRWFNAINKLKMISFMCPPRLFLQASIKMSKFSMTLSNKTQSTASIWAQMLFLRSWIVFGTLAYTLVFKKPQRK